MKGKLCMSGTVSMTRILFALLFLSSCGNLPIAYIQNFSSVNNVVFGFPEYEITENIYQEYENSFMKIRFGRGPHAILILAYIRDDVYEWVGADNVKIYTLNGRIIKTSGLTNNIEILKASDKLYSSEEVFETINLYNPTLLMTTLKRSSEIRDKTIIKLGKKIPVNRIEETFSVDSIGWRGSNVYYRNALSNSIEMVEQKIHPRLPVVKIEYYIKY